MAITHHTATPESSSAAIRPTPEYEDFSNSLCMDVFRAQSVLEGARAMLAQAVDTDDGRGMHIDNVLLDIDRKLNSLVGRLNESTSAYK